MSAWPSTSVLAWASGDAAHVPIQCSTGVGAAKEIGDSPKLQNNRSKPLRTMPRPLFIVNSFSICFPAGPLATVCLDDGYFDACVSNRFHVFRRKFVVCDHAVDRLGPDDQRQAPAIEFAGVADRDQLSRCLHHGAVHAR